MVELLAAFRWYILLRVQEVNLPPWRVGALLMLGIFFNMFMPGGTGGDVLKIYFLLKEIPKKKAEGLLAVLMDRLIGLLALIMISSVIIGIRYNWLKTNPVSRQPDLGAAADPGVQPGGIVFSFMISGFGLAHKLPAKMPMRDKLIDLSGRITRTRGRGRPRWRRCSRRSACICRFVLRSLSARPAR